jgi:hypothetical protein
MGDEGGLPPEGDPGEEDMLAGEEGGGDEGMSDEEDILAGPEDEEPLEGYDYANEERLLQEEAELNAKAKRREYVQKLWDKHNAPRSSFEYMMEQNELDGLSRTVPKNHSNNGKPGTPSMPYYDPNDEGILVEWSVDEDVRKEVITETKLILDSGKIIVEDEEIGEIQDSDLPAPETS